MQSTTARPSKVRAEPHPKAPLRGASRSLWSSHRSGNLDPADDIDETEPPIEWTEEEIVFLHWRLLKEVSNLADAETPLEAKLDTLRWVFTERDKDAEPFSFVSCLRVVGCSPLSPVAYCGLVDAEDVRDQIRHSAKRWLEATLERYPEWVRQAVQRNPEWIEAQLARNPQWINEQIKVMNEQGDLFGCGA